MVLDVDKEPMLSREEKLKARDNKIKADAENAKMARLYREHVLGEKPKEGILHCRTSAMDIRRLLRFSLLF